MVSDKQIHCFGLSHHHAPVELRESMKFELDDLKGALGDWAGDNGSFTTGDGDETVTIHELVLLSTCNRVELYVNASGETSHVRAALYELMTSACRSARLRAGLEFAARPPDRLRLTAALVYLTESEATRHLLAVACGIDSMVLGENQILTQIHGAVDEARAAGTLGNELGTLFNSAIRAGKRARCETSIGSRPASVATVAIALVDKALGGTRGRDVAVVGLGEMGRLAVKLLINRGVSRIRIVNRTPERALAMAHEISHTHNIRCDAYGLDDLGKVLLDTDAVVTATGADKWLMGVGEIRYAATRRAGQPLVIVDVGVPRDVDPAAASVEHVHLYDFDDIRLVQDEGLRSRQREIPAVERIIVEEMMRFDVARRRLWAKPLISSLRKKTESIRQQELQRTYEILGSPDPETWTHVQRMTRALVNKLLHVPTERIEEAAIKGEPDGYADAVRQLFGLEDATGSRNERS